MIDFELTEAEKQNILYQRKCREKAAEWARERAKELNAAELRKPGQLEVIKRVEAMLEEAGIEIETSEGYWLFQDSKSGQEICD